MPYEEVTISGTESGVPFSFQCCNKITKASGDVFMSSADFTAHQAQQEAAMRACINAQLNATPPLPSTTPNDTAKFLRGDGTWAVPPTGGAHSHPISEVTGLQTALDGKSASTHGHAIADTTGLQAALDGKSDSTHNHNVTSLTGFPGGTANFLRADGTFAAPAGGAGEPWEGKIHVAWGDGKPTRDHVLWGFQNTAVSVAGPTPTGIAVTVGRLVYFRFKSAITVNRIRYFGVGSVSNAYTMAIYRESDNARLWLLDPCNTTAATWTSISAGLPITLAADTGYWLGLSAKTTGTTAGFRTSASPIASSLGILTMPGNLNAYAGVRFAQVTLTSGAWPATLPTLAAAAFASAGTTGTVPIVFLDNSSA